MIKVGLILFSATLIIGVIIYSWFNRDSDRVILTLVIVDPNNQTVN